ncbi:MAG: peptidase S8 [Lachnospiraceae bacterium]|nr:peptidase S8 [Lachnospiraceae bacterium]
MEKVKKIVNAFRVYKNGYSGKNIRIALLDTGVVLHRELENRIVYFKDYVNNRNSIYDDNGHGTHIAGILCGKQCGMAPQAELLVFKILDQNGNGRTSDALKALSWILEHHREYDIRVLNFSMGYVPNANASLQQQLMDILDKLWDEGVIVVTAAGNNGPKENTITVPGISRKVITVGVFEELEDFKSDFRKYGGQGPTACCIVKPEILAPGTDILSLSNELHRYTRKSGTSMATPVVSGALALAVEKRRNLQPVEIKLLLYDTVKRCYEIDKKSHAWGVLDVDNLMKML